MQAVAHVKFKSSLGDDETRLFFLRAPEFLVAGRAPFFKILLFSSSADISKVTNKRLQNTQRQ